jgi:hypothetical protein
VVVTDVGVMNAGEMDVDVMDVIDQADPDSIDQMTGDFSEGG